MRKCAWQRWGSISVVLAAFPLAAQPRDVAVRVTVSDGFDFGARWQVELERPADTLAAGAKLECRVDVPPGSSPRAEVSCRLPQGGSAELGEADGSRGVLPFDIRVRSLRLLLDR